MSTIRRQSIIASFVVYIGFALGFLNTYLFTRQGGFTKEQFGLTTMFVAVAQLMYAIANIGMPAFITKFYPYYQAHLPPRKNDQLTLALLLPCLGFLPVIILGLVLKEPLINKIYNNSPELLNYYYWLFPFAFGYTIFMVLDVYAWQLRWAVLSNFMKEVVFRGFTTVLLLLVFFGVLHSFDFFIGLYSFAYILLMLFMLAFLASKGQLHLSRRISRVTKKFRKKIYALAGYVWGGGLIFSLASVIDTLFVAAILPNGMGAAGVFTFGQYMTSFIQAPQRAVVSAATGTLSQAWREKDYGRIQRIYQRSSINQLIFSCAVFVLIWLNFEDGIRTFHLQSDYLEARWVFFYFGLTRIVDMGTGVNGQIIGTSTRWRFDFTTGLILLALMLPLNFFLTRELGMIGPAIANLISFTIYNAIRCIYLWRNFSMQPFNQKSLLTLLLSGICFLLVFFPFREKTGFLWLVVRSLAFLVPFAAGTLWLRLSPDVLPVWQTLKKRVQRRA